MLAAAAVPHCSQHIARLTCTSDISNAGACCCRAMELMRFNIPALLHTRKKSILPEACSFASLNAEGPLVSSGTATV
jgi:hypothetical protein